MNSISVVTSYIISLLAVCIAITLVGLYYAKKISILECVIYAFATQAYAITQIGATITTLYIVQAIFAFNEFFFLIKNSKNIHFKNYGILLFFLPLISYAFSIADFYLKWGNHFYILGSHTSLFLSPLFFYIKAYIPFFLLISKLSREIRDVSFTSFFNILYNVALYSCFIGVFQYLLNLATSNTDIKAIFGLKAAFQSDDIEKIRISAFFPEPKHFSAFLALVIPLALHKKKYLISAFFFIVGVLTISQTFFVCLAIGFFCFFVFKKIKGTRKIILLSLSLLLLIATCFSIIKTNIIKDIDKYQDTFLYALVVERAIDRYDLDDLTSNNEFLGLPLQPDLELPIVNFLKDNAYLLWLGYAPGNGKYIPPPYFENSKIPYRYNKQLEENASVHMNMRWMYIVAEFGAVFFFFFFIIFTKVNISSNFVRHFYAYFWLIFFFNEIDYLLLLFFFLTLTVQNSNYKTNSKANVHFS